VDTGTDFPLWSERFDREMKDVFEVQDEMAREIAEALRELNLAVTLRANESSTLYNAACVYCGLNKKAEALDALRKAWEAGSRDPVWARRDPDLIPLYGDRKLSACTRRSLRRRLPPVPANRTDSVTRDSRADTVGSFQFSIVNKQEEPECSAETPWRKKKPGTIRRAHGFTKN
jgi:hypothetical protein